eukprot:766209-Hanusia_phi.AAC.2
MTPGHLVRKARSRGLEERKRSRGKRNGDRGKSRREHEGEYKKKQGHAYIQGWRGSNMPIPNLGLEQQLRKSQESYRSGGAPEM